MGNLLYIVTVFGSEDHTKWKSEGWQDALTFTDTWCPKNKVHIKNNFVDNNMCGGFFTSGILSFTHGHCKKQLVKMKREL